MRRVLCWFLVTAFLGFHAAYTIWHQHGNSLLRVSDGARLPFAEIVTDLYESRLVFVGELHDQISHHRAQLQVVEAFHEADRAVAIGLEMFRAETQPALNQWVAGKMGLEAFLGIYYDNWNFPWFYYQGILEYARDHGIPLVGLNVPRELIRQVARDGFASLTPEQLGELPVVRCEVDSNYENFIRRALGMHGEHGRTFLNFCEAQLVWDTAMALHLKEFLDENPDHTVVVIAGSGHAWKRGIPEQIAQLAPTSTRVIVPEIPERLERATVSTGDADYLWMGITTP